MGAADPMFTLGVITDEIHPDPEVAVPAARDLGFTHVELNRIGERGIHELEDDAVDALGALIAAAGLHVVAVDPPSFKAVELEQVAADAVLEDAALREHLSQIERCCVIAPRLGAPLIRVFSFRRSYMTGAGNPSPREPEGGTIPDELLPKIVAGLRAAADIAAEHGVTLGLENVRSCWGNSGRNAARILAAVEHPHLRAIWDPGNDYVSGGLPFPDGYEAVRPYLAHVHVKDAVVEDEATGLTRWACIGSGAVDYAGQLQALRDDNYTGVVSVETHWRKPGDRAGLASTRDTTSGLRRFL